MMNKRIKKKKMKQRKGDETMNTVMDSENQYKRLDVNMLRSKNSTTVSYEESLQDIEPIDWSDEVLSGQKKVTIIGSK